MRHLPELPPSLRLPTPPQALRQRTLAAVAGVRPDPPPTLVDRAWESRRLRTIAAALISALLLIDWAMSPPAFEPGTEARPTANRLVPFDRDGLPASAQWEALASELQLPERRRERG